MSSEIFENLGIDPAVILIALAVLVVVLLIVVIVCMMKLSSLRADYEDFMRGDNGKSLEKTIKDSIAQFHDLEEMAQQNRQQINALDQELGHTVQKVGMVKYDAFDEIGGKLSFALALLDRRNTGVLLNTIHTADGCYIYIKDIIRGEGVLLLSDDEKEAVRRAIDGEPQVQQVRLKKAAKEKEKKDREMDIPEQV